jgi:hypothetical protein
MSQTIRNSRSKGHERRGLEPEFKGTDCPSFAAASPQQMTSAMPDPSPVRLVLQSIEITPGKLLATGRHAEM